jgi:hypothetical protein
MTDAELIKKFKQIKDPKEAIETFLEHSEFIGYDPYYKDLHAALFEMLERAVA